MINNEFSANTGTDDPVRGSMEYRSETRIDLFSKTLRIMLKLRAILLPILTVCMFTQPFCFHCIAEMRAMIQCAESKEKNPLEIKADSLPVESKSVCTKKNCLSTPKFHLDNFQKFVCDWLGLLPAEVIPSCFTSFDTNILSGNNTHCPAWLRLSVLLI